jgi:flagellar biogenesis protein FliO
MPEPGAFGGMTEVNVGFEHFVNVTKYRSIVIFSTLALVVAIVGLVFWSFRLLQESFFQELSIVLASGIATFVGTPVVVKLATGRREYVLPPMLLIAVGCGFFAHEKTGVVQELLVETSVALCLLIALEMLLHRFMESVAESYKAAEANISKRATDLDERVRQFDLRAGGHGYGASDQYMVKPEVPKKT